MKKNRSDELNKNYTAIECKAQERIAIYIVVIALCLILKYYDSFVKFL